MSTTNRRDVQLVITAKNEGQRVVEQAKDALRALFDAQGQLGSGSKLTAAQLADVGRAISAVEKAAAPMDAAVRKGEEAFARQNKTLADTKQQLKDVEQQLQAAKRAQDAIGPKLVDAKLNGQDREVGKLVEQLRAAEQAQRALERQRESLKGSITAQEIAVGKATSSLQQLGSQAHAVELAMSGIGTAAQREMAKAAAAAEATRQKYADLAATAKAEVANRKFDQFMGVNPDAGKGSAAKSGSVWIEQDRQLEQLIKRFQEFRAAEDEVQRAADQVRGRLNPLVVLEAQLAKEVDQATRAWKAGKLSIEEYQAEVDRASAKLRAAQLNTEEWRKLQDGLAQATKKAADEERRLSGEAESLRARIDPMAAAQAKFTAELEKLNNLKARGKITADELAAGERMLKAEVDAVAASLARQANGDFIAGMQRLAEAIRIAAQEEKKLVAETDALRAKIDPLGAIQDRLNASLQRANELHKLGRISATELANAEKVLRQEAQNAADALERVGKGANGKIGFLGLKPYELQNLGYQVNDVFTQIASGTSVTQTLAQQGGQILQLFPKVGDAIIGAFKSPPILATVAAVALLAAGIGRLMEEAGRLRTFQGLLLSVAEGARYNAQELVALARDLRAVGFSSDEATASLSSFVRSGVRPERMAQFAQVALDLSDALGIELAQATELVSRGFTGQYDDLMRLQEATQVLTAAELERIRTLYEEGRASEARTTALALFSQRMDQAADSARGPWKEAMRTLNSAWQAFLDNVAVGIRYMPAMAGLLDNMAASARRARGELGQSQATQNRTQGLTSAIAHTEQRIRDAEQRLARLSASARSTATM